MKRNESFFSDSDDEEDRPIVNTGRRISVSAESINPEDGVHEKVTYPKTDAQRERIRESVRNNFLFKRLDEELYTEVIDAMFEKTVSSGEEIIKQGAPGDYFYVVESGTFDVFVAKGNNAPIKVTDYTAGASFGELALMYNAPRAATIIATSNSIVWALDRNSFRRMLMDTTFKKRRMYEKFLEEVPLLTSLEPYERHKIADALDSISFDDKDVVIRQGDSGTTFYIIEAGEATVTQLDADGNIRQVASLKKGDYFGELALLTDKPRAATVTAKGRLKCVTLNQGGFTRLLGPCLDILKRNTDNYENYSKTL